MSLPENLQNEPRSSGILNEQPIREILSTIACIRAANSIKRHRSHQPSDRLDNMNFVPSRVPGPLQIFATFMPGFPLLE